MKTKAWLILLPLLACWPLIRVSAQNLQPVSVSDSSLGFPAGADGDSRIPILSPDGRYVLFASSADNLVISTNRTALAVRLPAALNVYLRDRTNQTTTLVSATLSGTPAAQGDSLPIAVSTNGRYALFQSSAPALVPADTNNAADVFVRDTLSGSTVLVSINTNGMAGAGPSRDPAMTPDGRYVVFVSAANDLVPGDTNRIPDVFVRDLQSGTTMLISVGATFTNAVIPVGGSESPQITPDGRYVAFRSTATNLLPGVPTGGDIYVRDLAAGQTIWASSGARSILQATLGATNAICFNHMLSDDGRYVAYEACAAAGSNGVILRYNLSSGFTDVVHTNASVQASAFEDIRSLDMTSDGRYLAFIANAGAASNLTTCVQVWDSQTASLLTASIDRDGQVPTNSVCDWPKLDPTGRFVTFLSTAVNLVTNATPGDHHLYVRDLQTGNTSLVDANNEGLGTPLSPACVPSVSADGRLVAFECPDSGLVPNDRNHASDVLVRDWIGDTIELTSVHDPSLQSIAGNAPSALTTSSLNADGTLIAFVSEADNLVPNDTNKLRDVFLRDLANHSTTLISANTNGLPGDGISTDPSISADGRYVAFSSQADDLVVNDTNRGRDVFVRDLQTGVTSLISVNADGTGPGGRQSFAPVIASSGRYVLFRSQAQNLGIPGNPGVILRDRQAQIYYGVSGVSSFGVDQVVMTPDASRVFYAAVSAGTSLYVWDLATSSTIYSNTFQIYSPYSLAISANGKTIACGSRNNLLVADVESGTSKVLETDGVSYLGLQLSGDGRLLVFGKRSIASPLSQVYLDDLESGNNFLISRIPDASAPAGGNSDSPQISSDGRFIAYRSAATNLVSYAGDGLPQIYVFDRQTASTELLSLSYSTGGFSSGSSGRPVFSADGQTLAFQNWASDVTAHDLNQTLDVFAFTFLRIALLPGTVFDQGPWLSWPYVPDQQYRVQFKDALDLTDWQDLTGVISNNGTKAFFQDSAPGVRQRFYRVGTF